MASTKSHKARQDTSDVPRLLTRSEMASLKRDMQESSAWMKEELDRRYPPKKAKARTGRVIPALEQTGETGGLARGKQDDQRRS